MRYKNLTIMVSLGCLSLVALAGLVMLPITEVISCSGNDEEWYKPNNTFANFYAYHKYPGDANMGWRVYAEISVYINEDGYGVSSARATPAMVDAENLRLLYEEYDYTKNSKSYYRNATVRASVFPYYHKYGAPDEYINTPYPSTTLIATAMKTTKSRAYVNLVRQKDGKTHEGWFEMTAGGNIKRLIKLEGSAGYKYIDTHEDEWSASVKDTETTTEFGEGKPTEKSASFIGSSLGGSAGASVRGFGMQGCCFREESVYLQLDDPYDD